MKNLVTESVREILRGRDPSDVIDENADLFYSWYNDPNNISNKLAPNFHTFERLLNRFGFTHAGSGKAGEYKFENSLGETIHVNPYDTWIISTGTSGKGIEQLEQELNILLSYK